MGLRGKSGRRSRGRQKKKLNRYNPNAPDYQKVHAPWMTKLLESLPSPFSGHTMKEGYVIQG